MAEKKVVDPLINDEIGLVTVGSDVQGTDPSVHPENISVEEGVDVVESAPYTVIDSITAVKEMVALSDVVLKSQIQTHLDAAIAAARVV